MKKKILSVILTVFMAVSMFSMIPAAADTTITAKPTASKVIVNGEEISFDAYLINDNNYFKLRDLAYVLNGTEKQFEFVYDEATKAISLTNGKAYTEVGGEMTGKGAGNKTATPTESKIYLDGKEISLTAYMVEGNNYFKLRDIAQAFDFYVEWRESQNTIIIYTSQKYLPGKEFAEAFGYFDVDFKESIVQYWDTGKEKVKFEMVADEETGRTGLAINGNKVDIEYLLWFGQIIVIDDIVIITTGGTDVRSMRLYIFDFNGNTLFKTYYLNNKGMVIDSYIFIDDNKIIMPGTRLTHGINLVMKNRNTQFSEYSDYLYQDTVYKYENLIYNDVSDTEVYLYDGTAFTEESAILDKNEIIEGDFTLEYLGGGKFGKIKMTENFTTLEQYFLAISPARVNELADKMEDAAIIDMFETKLYNNAKTVMCWYMGGDLGLDLNKNSTFCGDDGGKYVEVKNIKDTAVLKANYEAVFSRRLLDNSLYPVLFEVPVFVEHNGKLYFNTGLGGGMTDEPDFTRARVINKNADTFEIEMPMANGTIFTYKVVQQNGNWVLDSFFYFDANDNNNLSDNIEWKTALENFLTQFPSLYDFGNPKAPDADGIYLPFKCRFQDLDSDNIPEAIITFGVPEGEWVFDKAYKLYDGSYEQIGQAMFIFYTNTEGKLVAATKSGYTINAIYFAEIQNKKLILNDYIDSKGNDNFNGVKYDSFSEEDGTSLWEATDADETLKLLPEIDCSDIFNAAKSRIK